jgi:transposase
LDRMVLRDEQGERVAPLLPGKVGDPGQSAADNRLLLEAVLWIARVGAPWRDLPKSFGKWNSAFKRFRRWAGRGVFEQVFTALSEDADFEYVTIDGTIVRVHQHGTGARGDPEPGHRTVPRWPDDEDRRPPLSRGQALVDALGNLVRFVLLPGQRHDGVGVDPLLKDIDFAALLADKAFDSDAIRAELNERGALAVIPPKANRVRHIPCDLEMYKWRHLVGNFSCSLKAFRRIATRYDKTDSSYAAMIHLAGSVLALR